MRIPELIQLLEAKVLTECDLPESDIQYAFASDMMSDVLAYADRHMLLITSLTNPQTIRTAEMLDLDCVLYVRGKIPSAAALAMAEDRNITVLTTKCTMFNTCGILYDTGIRGGNLNDNPH